LLPGAKERKDVAFNTDDDLIEQMLKIGFEVSERDCRLFVPLGFDGKYKKGVSAYRVIESHGLLIAEKYCDS
jgi:hypothetical protein